MDERITIANKLIVPIRLQVYKSTGRLETLPPVRYLEAPARKECVFLF